ncbi:MAG: outer membrane lipid asymmetry maintenance protein MlaD [Gammaproteobacteria bacterium]|jgi:phospholipid/cholesterol/gamma-HCH transport system substrate-binding protein|nr:outer membrane lipid asymmetry maintenance protein MlaD [Gammaproteobacteria bacterium]
MESTRTHELGTGLFVFLGFAALLFLATQTTNMEQFVDGSGYRVTARFSDVAGLKTRAQVTLAGVSIGRVESIDFDNDRLDALVTLRIDPEYNRIPDDSDASVVTAGLLGSKYIGIGPGGADTYLSDGSEIQITQSAIVLEDVIGRLVFSLSQGGQGD